MTFRGIRCNIIVLCACFYFLSHQAMAGELDRLTLRAGMDLGTKLHRKSTGGYQTGSVYHIAGINEYYNADDKGKGINAQIDYMFFAFPPDKSRLTLLGGGVMLDAEYIASSLSDFYTTTGNLYITTAGLSLMAGIGYVGFSKEMPKYEDKSGYAEASGMAFHFSLMFEYPINDKFGIYAQFSEHSFPSLWKRKSLHSGITYKI